MGAAPVNLDNQRIPRLRLLEAIAWCSAQELESDPHENEEVKNRRRLAERATELFQAAYRAHKDDVFRRPEHQEIKRLYAEASVGSIAPLERQLRTIALKPPSDISRVEMAPKRRGIVEEVAGKRAEQLRASGIHVGTADNSVTGGRILLFVPDDTLSDGAARYASKGFFDADNVPPWDTWVCYFGRCLMAWVPFELESLANAGINANPEECITWATSDFVESVFELAS
jgi:hypothetical protein